MVGQQTIDFIETEAVKNARVSAGKAWKWIKEDQRRFIALQRAVFYLVEEKRLSSIQRDRVDFELRRFGYKLTDTPSFCFSHNLWAPLARYLRALYPWLKKFIEIRTDCSHPYHLIEFLAIPSDYLFSGAHCVGRPITRRDWE